MKIIPLHFIVNFNHTQQKLTEYSYQIKSISTIFLFISYMFSQQTVSIGNYSFTPSTIIGKGATGKVYQGIRNHDGQTVAIKIIDLNQNQNQITKALLETQKKALKLLKPNPNVIKLLDIIQDGSFCYIITEIYNGGTLKDYLATKGRLTEDEALKIFRFIISGYCSISDSSIIHRDLKPANIMLQESGLKPVIIDFGFCEIIQIKTVMRAYNVGSPSYMSPEAYKKTLYSEKSDIWSLGIIFYEMLTGETLDEGIEIKSFFETISDNFISQKLAQFAGVSKEILEQVIRLNPQDRISCHKIKYILDKNAIFGMNISKNPITNPHLISHPHPILNPHPVSTPHNILNPHSISNLHPFSNPDPNLLTKFSSEQDNQQKLPYQPTNLTMTSSGITQTSPNPTPNLTFQANGLSFKMKQAQSIIRQNFDPICRKVNSTKNLLQSLNCQKVNLIQYRKPLNQQMLQSIHFQQEKNTTQTTISNYNTQKSNNLKYSYINSTVSSNQITKKQPEPLAFRQKDHLNRVIITKLNQNLNNKKANILRNKNQNSLRYLGKQNNLEYFSNPSVQDYQKYTNPLSEKNQKFSFKKMQQITQNHPNFIKNLDVFEHHQQNNPLFQKQNTDYRIFMNQKGANIPNNQMHNTIYPSQKVIVTRNSVMVQSNNFIQNTRSRSPMSSLQGNCLNQRII